jgi:hypothetical protein
VATGGFDRHTSRRIEREPINLIGMFLLISWDMLIYFPVLFCLVVTSCLIVLTNQFAGM